MPAQMTVKEFLADSRKAHGRRYDYSRAKTLEQVVEIGCPEHGWFRQRRWSHARGGDGCPDCGRAKKVQGMFLSKAKFVERAQRVHGDTYDYSKVVYVNGKSKVQIGCPTHGMFEQRPNTHVSSKAGCPACGVARTIRSGLTKKTVRRQGKVFHLQGVEPLALDWILRTQNIEAQDIKCGSQVPVVPYLLEGKSHKHYPDLWLPKQRRLIEVKSMWTAGLESDPRQRHAFRSLKAKRQAALELGYRYTLLLFDRNRRRLKLPADWHLLSLLRFKKQLSAINP